MTADRRVHRALAQAGVASRRGAETLIREGRVTINGTVAAIGQMVSDSDHLAVDGIEVRPEPICTYIFNKPMGVVSTASDPQGRPTVLDTLPGDVRLYPIGRLDINTTGLLLITNDGDLAHRLMHPRSRVSKIYEVLVDGRVSAAGIRALRNGIDLDDGPTQPAKVDILDRQAPGGTWLSVEITEGRNRQVRRMCEAIGHRVRRLVRTRYAGLGLGRLERGEFRMLSSAEIAKLETMAGMRQ
ncbi:MAG: rRNA pseudouridine synthase [Thermoleophilia bacterium]|nr:rRNA pseudouridine synthase [Thermoleophilia bacterium]